MKKADTIELRLAGLQGSIAALVQVVRANTTALDELRSQKNLIPALCHSLDRLQAEFTALRLSAHPKGRMRK